ncbi:TIGR04282 family arsenosugar biosynthesis glycosyltransferase [Sporomusa acidovorans]|uniref:2-phospho-L-lactate guanylyltransferase n=1 Tax=Sporomusa acidovorans (strain ATCC 49682 / DSM 3132 / Mol) TaxID=1123286 RepID=A0ABZ3IZJ2_SPOA4|nr:DUF2064 domain-containing protein [Sporomusa acidovorans]OZC16846.1 2-phospho-L-lactate guanylyltransferase [Sporomusa acidovorans DSM 3132]SDF24271.1 Uncharacterized conserved protein, glycosyltransferase A (GT-A) superfamily, DUF2064 family [Sporomusa acidovorans]
MKNAIVLFAKVPKAGDNKTRLTAERGGIFTVEEAKEFYEASLLDVIDSCIAADCGDVYICYNLNGDRDYLHQLVKSTFGAQALKDIFPDEGKSFDQGMQYAVDYIFKNGSDNRLADSVFILGGDTPTLQPATLKEAVKKLEAIASTPQAFTCAKKTNIVSPAIGAGIIESVDQEGGFNLIGYTYATPFSFNGVFYNQDGITALDMIAFKAAEQTIPVGIVEMIPDIDLPADLASLIPVLNTLKIAKQYDSTITLPTRTLHYLEELGIQTTAPVSAIID